MEEKKKDSLCGGACPCPRTKCERYGDCESCRKKHTKSAPYCKGRREKRRPAKLQKRRAGGLRRRRHYKVSTATVRFPEILPSVVIFPQENVVNIRRLAAVNPTRCLLRPEYIGLPA